jgi:hypothetical protein
VSEEPTHGLIATLARYIQTWFAVLIGGARFYATDVLSNQYSNPGEFFLLTLLVTGLAAVGVGTLASPFEESRTGEEVARYVVIMLLPVTLPVFWAIGRTIAGKLTKSEVSFHTLWRLVSYSNAPAVLVVPFHGMVHQAINVALPADTEVPERIEALIALALGAWGITYFLRGIWLTADRHRPLVTALTLICSLSPGALVTGGIAIVAPWMRHQATASFATPILGAARSAGNWPQEIRPGESFELIITVKNVSGVMARDVVVRLVGPSFTDGGRTALFVAFVDCTNCTSASGAETLGTDQPVTFHQNRLEFLRGRRRAPLPFAAGTADVFQYNGLTLGNVNAGVEETLRIGMIAERGADAAVGEQLTCVTLDALRITRTSAQLTARPSMLRPERMWFDFGTTPNLGYSIEADGAVGTAKNLKPGTTYYYRYVTTVSHGPQPQWLYCYGETRSFTTPTR